MLLLMPPQKMRCRRKEPCRLFTARKRPKVEEVSTTTLCQCPTSHSCPSHHRHPSVLLGTVYPLDNLRTYKGFCYPDGSAPSQETSDLLEDEDETPYKEQSLHGTRYNRERAHSKTR